jgi:hypothetical protein
VPKTNLLLTSDFRAEKSQEGLRRKQNDRAELLFFKLAEDSFTLISGTCYDVVEAALKQGRQMLKQHGEK